jgi:hypothetical protein
VLALKCSELVDGERNVWHMGSNATLLRGAWVTITPWVALLYLAPVEVSELVPALLVCFDVKSGVFICQEVTQAAARLWPIGLHCATAASGKF